MVRDELNTPIFFNVEEKEIFRKEAREADGRNKRATKQTLQ